jgi:hypothetical protein
MYKQNFMNLIDREARAVFDLKDGVTGGRYSFITRTNHGSTVEDSLEKIVIFVETRMINGVSIYGIEWGVRQSIPLQNLCVNDIGSLDSVKGVRIFGYLKLGGLDSHPIQNSATVYTDDFETITQVEFNLPEHLKERGAKRIVGPRMHGRKLDEVLPGLIKRYARMPVEHLCVLPGE